MENRTRRARCTAFQQDCMLRHFRKDLNRYDTKILSKDDVQFQSFRKALDSGKKAGICTEKALADLLTVQDEEQLWSSATIGCHFCGKLT